MWNFFRKYRWFIIAEVVVFGLAILLYAVDQNAATYSGMLIGGSVIVAIITILKWCYTKYIEPDYTPSIAELLDGIISGDIKKQVIAYVALISIIIVVICSLAIISGEHIISEATIGDKIWRVICYFIDPGNVHEEVSLSVRIATFIIAMLSMVLMSGMLITTLTNIIERRVQSVERGEVTYNNIYNHFVIIGYSDITLCIINKIYANLNIATAPKLILLTEQDITKIHSEILSQLPIEYDDKIIIYNGSIHAIEQIERLKIESAREVYILGEQSEYGRDVKSLECVRTVSKLRGSVKNKGLLKVNVQIDRIPSYSIIQKLNFGEHAFTHIEANGEYESTPNIYFRPFNFHENWARLLWSYHRTEKFDELDFEPMRGENKHVHLVIAGFSRMGRAMLLEALRICHYCNFVEECAEDGVEAQNRTKITIVDSAMGSLLPFFKTQYPHLDQIKDIEIEYIDKSIEDESVREMLCKAAMDNTKLLTVAICIKDPDMGLSVGLNLPEEIFVQRESIVTDGRRIKENNTRSKVLIYQEMLEGIGSIISKDMMRYKAIKIFGMLNEGVDERLLGDHMAMCASAIYNNTISELAGADKDNNFVDRLYDLVVKEECRNRALIEEIFNAMEIDWAIKQENMRWANRYQIDIYNTYIKELERVGVTSYQQLDTLSNDDIHTFAQMEHMRWIGERSVMGWRQIREGEVRNDDALIHDLILPFNTLKSSGEDEIEKDRAVIKSVLQLNAIFMALEQHNMAHLS